MAFDEVSALSEDIELIVVEKGEILQFSLGFYTFLLKLFPCLFLIKLCVNTSLAIIPKP